VRGGGGIDLAVLAIAANIGLSALLGVFLLVATAWPAGDVVPRPILVATLFGAPAIVAELGRRSARRQLIAAAGIGLLPQSFLAFSGVTLIFVIPAVMYLAAAARLPASTPPSVGPNRGQAIVAGMATLAIPCLLVAATVAVLIVLTGSGCWSAAAYTACGTGLTTWPGLAMAVACLASAITIARWIARASAS
jgi:hypothetical protein